MEALVSEGSHRFTDVCSPFGKHIVQEAVWKGITHSQTISVSGFNSLQIIYYSIVEMLTTSYYKTLISLLLRSPYYC